MKLRWIGQNGYILKTKNTTVIIDPYLSDSVNRVAGRPRLLEAPVAPADVEADGIICTHNHLDHLDVDTIAAMDRDRNTFYAPKDCMETLQELGVRNRVCFDTGDQVRIGDFCLEAVFADHTVPAIGVIVRAEGRTLWFTGDTLYHEKLEEMKEYGIDCMFVCINGKLGNMNAQEAARLDRAVRPLTAVPAHYGMFASNTEDPHKFTGQVSNGFIMEFDREYELSELLGRNGACMDLSGRRALVTGSSRGIGSAVVLELARAGADVVVHCAGNVKLAEEVCGEVRAMGRQCTVVQADLRTPEGADRLIAKAGHLDILVLNASVQYRRPWDQITPDEFYDQINCNLLSSLLLMQQAVPAMKEQHWGRIVTIGSVQEEKPHPDMLVYASSKAAQTLMAKSLAAQLAPFGITVNNVAPGVICTDRNKEALSDPVYARTVADSIPMKFYGEKEDCAGIVRLLCSREGRYITGQSIFVDGGKSL